MPLGGLGNQAVKRRLIKSGSPKWPPAPARQETPWKETRLIDLVGRPDEQTFFNPV